MNEKNENVCRRKVSFFAEETKRRKIIGEMRVKKRPL